MKQITFYDNNENAIAIHFASDGDIRINVSTIGSELLAVTNIKLTFNQAKILINALEDFMADDL